MPLLIYSLLSLALLSALIQIVFISKAFPWDVILITHLWQNPVVGLLYKFLYLMTLFANTETVVTLLFCMIVGAVLRKTYRFEVALFTLNVAIAAVLEKLIKHQFARFRPVTTLKHVYLSTYSFPSGHAMLAVCFYGLFFYFLARRFPEARMPIGCFAVFFAGVIGVSRFMLKVHYISDVLGGYLVAVPILCFSIFLYNRCKADVSSLTE